MSYRFDQDRMRAQMREVINASVGQQVTWWQRVSAVTGVVEMGQGDTVYSAARTITAVVGQWTMPRMMQMQTPAGMIPAGETFITCQHAIGKDDTIVYRGNTYRIDSEPQYSPVTSSYVAVLKRGY